MGLKCRPLDAARVCTARRVDREEAERLVILGRALPMEAAETIVPRFAHFTGGTASRNRPTNIRFNCHLRFRLLPLFLPRSLVFGIDESAERNNESEEIVLREQWNAQKRRTKTGVG